MLEIMLSVMPKFSQYEFVIAAVSNLPLSFYEKYTRIPHVSVVIDQTYDLLSHATAALVASGTATLETALFEVPQVVCYKTGYISYQIAKSLIQVKYISLVNLIADRELVKELIQDKLTVHALAHELKKILPYTSHRNELIKEYKQIKALLGGPGASERAASLIVKYLRTENKVPD